MSNDLKAENDGIQLPTVLAIGFTGHRTLHNEAASREVIYEFLAEKKRSTLEILVGVSSVGVGGDLLFAESCIALGIPLRVLLPLSDEEFRKDFDSAMWERVQQVVSRAMSVEVTGTEGQRDERYYECGLATVLQSQMQVALWNGEAARGLGGTEQIVSFARQIGRPVVWIHSVTGVVEADEARKVWYLQSDRELKFLNHLRSSGIRVANDSPSALAAAWLLKLDANAVLVAPQVKRLAALPIVCTALAALVSGAASRMQASNLWAGVGAVLGLTAALLPTVLRLGKRQALWVRIRTAAEVSRSVGALWETPAAYEVVGPEILPELSGMIVSLNFLKSMAGKAVDGGVNSFRAKYLDERVVGQKSYFKQQSIKAAARGKRYRAIGTICVICGIAISMWIFASKSMLKVEGVGSWAAWLPLVASALFQGATVVGALLVVNDCDRRRRRYLEIYESLVKWELELRAFHTWPPVLLVVNKIERALLVELLEWRSLLQNTKMPRN